MRSTHHRACKRPLRVLVVALALSQACHAERVIPTSDTEYLALTSQLVVEGTLTRQWLDKPRQFGDSGVWSVKVTDVLAGPFDRSVLEWLDPNRRQRDRDVTTRPASKLTPGDLIFVDGINCNCIAGDILGGGTKPRALAAGDRLILFLSRSDPRRVGRVAGVAADWTVDYTDMRYVAGEETFPFVQWWGPDGEWMTSTFITMSRENFVGFRPASRKAIRERVARAIEGAPALWAKIEAATASDLPMLLKICADRREAEPGEATAPRYWAGMAGARFDEVADVDAIVALFASPATAAEAAHVPDYVLGSRADCREQVLQYLERAAGDAERRMAAAGAMRDAGKAYRRDLSDAAGHGAPLPHDGRFARRLAAAAVGTSEAPLARSLVQAVRECVAYPGDHSSRELDADLAAAADVLVDAFPKLDGQLQFEAAVTLQSISPGQGGRVAPATGRFITQLAEVTARQNPQPLDRAKQVRMQYRWHNLLPVKGPPATLALVFRRQTDGREFERPIDAKPTGMREDGRGSFGSAWQVEGDLPPGVTAGTYHAFLRVREGDETIGEGLGCTVAVP